MNVTYLKTKTLPKINNQELHKRLAFHVAGQAVSICLGNKKKGLPCVSFRIIKQPFVAESTKVHYLTAPAGHLIAKVEGGRLFNALPAIVFEESETINVSQQQYFQKAFEADVANILAGPLAEAKYVAQRDDEAITARLVNFKALAFYNGASEVELVSTYFKCINLPKNEEEQKIVDIYFDTFSFLSEFSNWRLITKLADYVLDNDKPVIEAAEVIAVIDKVSV